MKVKKTIHCYEINGTPYLLPFGQGIMDHEKGFATNAVGKALWEMLQNGMSKEEMVDQLMLLYEATEDERPILETDVNAFMTSIQNHGYLDLPLYEPQSKDSLHQVNFGPLAVQYQIPEQLFTSYFSAFETKNDISGLSPDQTVIFCRHYPPAYPNGTVLVRSDEILIMDTDQHYVILPLQGHFVQEIHCTKDGRLAKIYGTYDACDACHEELFAALRFPFLILAQQKGLCVMHSASLLYNNMAWLFSGHAGAGKSTHVTLWHETFGTPWINGDLNILGIKNGQAVCYGLPWCGTSGIFTPGEFALGGVVFLKKAPFNKVSGIPADQFTLLLAQRLITPNWTAEMMQKSISIAEKLTSCIQGFRLECTKDPSAAQVMKESIDHALKH